MDEQNRVRLAQAISQGKRIVERERLGFVRGLGQRAIENLRALGYSTLDSIAVEDPDTFALRTGLGIRKARQIVSSSQQIKELEATLRREMQEAADRGEDAEPAPSGSVLAAEADQEAESEDKAESPVAAARAAVASDDLDGWGDVDDEPDDEAKKDARPGEKKEEES
jgi:hypothetical protein